MRKRLLLMAGVAMFIAACSQKQNVVSVPPSQIDVEQLKLASLPYGSLLTPYLCCESSMFHFKRRKYQLLGNAAAGPMPDVNDQAPLTLGIDRPWLNTDSEFSPPWGKSLCAAFIGAWGSVIGTSSFKRFSRRTRMPPSARGNEAGFSFVGPTPLRSMLPPPSREAPG